MNTIYMLLSLIAFFMILNYFELRDMNKRQEIYNKYYVTQNHTNRIPTKEEREEIDKIMSED